MFALADPNTVAANTATTRGIAIAHPAAPAKSAYTQLIASAQTDATAIIITVENTTLSTWTSAVDIAVGASGSEVVIVNNVICGAQQTTNALSSWFFPIMIPQGSPISARAQGDSGDTVYVTCHILGGDFGWPACAGVDSVGYNTSNGAGTTVDTSATANTIGPWVPIVASSARDYVGFSIGLDVASGGAGSHANSFLDIGVGAAGSEIVILEVRTQKDVGGPLPIGSGPYFIPIPAGTRISARTQSSSAVLGNRRYGITIYGIYQ
jgi:hypothetical protein